MRDTPTAKPKLKPRANAKAGTKAKPKTKPNAKRPAGASAPARRRRFLHAAMLAVVLVGLLFGFVYPTRTFLDQRNATSSAQTQLELLQAENKKLAQESKLLSSDAEIERLARERYGLVKPGEKAFVIVPAPTAPAPTTGSSSSSSPSSTPTTTADSTPSRRP